MLEPEKQVKSQILNWNSFHASAFELKKLQRVRFCNRKLLMSQILNLKTYNVSDFEREFSLRKPFFDIFYSVKTTYFAFLCSFQNHRVESKIEHVRF